jgi:BirA family biotin operon repressor/biotin-[acetyl-CoA-carboxylase] ligase
MTNTELDQLSDQLLAKIRHRPRHPFSLSQLARKLKCTEGNLNDALKLLLDSGYKIKIPRNKDCIFITAPDLLLATEIKNGLKTKFIGQTVYSFKSVQSTNTIAARLADTHATKGTLPAGQVPEGTVVVAEAQTKGRGRLGRKWHSPERAGIYLSVILFPDIDPAKAPGLSLMTAVSLADTLTALDKMKINIKWPNDCLINDRKVAGILTELSAEIGRVHHVIIGVGINVNQKRREFPAMVAKTATSIRAELKREIQRVDFVQTFLKNLEAAYIRFQKSGLKGFRKKILLYSNLIGTRVRLDMRGSIIAGKAIDIDEDGNLVLETREGLKAFNSGEVTVVKEKYKS